jgi:hypothetical protein
MNPPVPEGSGSSFRQKTQRSQNPPPPKPSLAVPPAPRPQQPIVPKLDRVAFDTNPSSRPQANLVGRVVEADSNNPKAGARLLLVNDASKHEQPITADPSGQFRAQLASGKWRVYVHDAKGKPVYHSQVQVTTNEVQQVTLVSR